MENVFGGGGIGGSSGENGGGFRFSIIKYSAAVKTKPPPKPPLDKAASVVD